MTLTPQTAHLIAAEFGPSSTTARRRLIAMVLSAATPAPRLDRDGVWHLVVAATVDSEPVSIPLDRLLLMLRDTTSDLDAIAEETQQATHPWPHLFSFAVDGVCVDIAAAPATDTPPHPRVPPGPTFTTDHLDDTSTLYSARTAACEVCGRSLAGRRVRRSTPGGAFVHVECGAHR